MTQLREVVGDDGVRCDPSELYAYHGDGFPIARGRPSCVVLPTDTQQVSQCVRILASHRVGIVPRGSGTGLTGGCVVFDDGVMITTTRMTRIESIDLSNRMALVQAGVRNRALCDAVRAYQHRQPPNATSSDALAGVHHCLDREFPIATLWFSPDPSSETIATIGGNAATNAGGINTLKYGVTTSHILGLEIVLADGQIVTTRAKGLRDSIGPDLPGLICGSEGTLGIITRLWCRLTVAPGDFRTIYAVFADTDHACQAVSDIIATGTVPSAMEVLDGAMIQVVEQAFRYGFPVDAGALLLVDVTGMSPGLDEELGIILDRCHENRALEVRHCSQPSQRSALWAVRKRAFGAIGRISRSYCTQDACIPRSKLSMAMKQITHIGRQFGLTITNVFHAGDGNIHPILLFDEDDPEDVQRILKASEQILEYCISIGGTLTGEHGVGIEKLHLMPRMFSPATLETFARIKQALDPDRLINDAKLIASPRLNIQLLNPMSPNTPGGAL